MKAMELYTKCQICDTEGVVPQSDGLFGSSIHVPDNWWLLTQSIQHHHTSDDEVCNHAPPPRFVVCSLDCVQRLADLIPIGGRVD